MSVCASACALSTTNCKFLELVKKDRSNSGVTDVLKLA